MAESIEFRLQVIEDKLGLVLSQNEKKAKSLGTALQVALGTFASATITKGISLASDGISTLNNFIKESVSASSDAELSLKKLEVALSGTGQLTKENVDSLKEFAAQIQLTTSYEDDFVIANAALIQSLGRLDSEGLKRATAAAVDLSSALGIDLESASRILGKAAEGNTVALSKLGIEFKKGGTEAETFASILSSIESRFGGSAQNQVKTFAGAVAQLSNTWGEFKENLGAVLTQNPAIIAAFSVLKDGVIALTKSLVDSFGSQNKDIFADFFRLILDSSSGIIVSFDAIARVISASVNVSLAAIRMLALGITTPVAATLELLSLIPKVGESFKSAADIATQEVFRLSEAFDKNISNFSSSISGETFLSKISDQIADARVNFDVLYNEIKNKSEDLKNNKVVAFDETDTEKLRTLNAELLAVDLEYNLAKRQLEEENRIGEKERFLAKTVEDLNSLRNFELEKSKILYESSIALAEASLRGEELRVAKEKAAREKELRDLKINGKNKSDIRAQELSDQQSFFSAASSLASSSNKELAMIGKASAITEIAIRTPRAVAQSYEFGTRIGGPVLGATLGAIAAAAMTAQAAKVAGVQGFANGGIVGATSGTDNQIATVREGEMYLNAPQQKKLFDMINSGSGNGDIIIQINEREIARAVRNQLNGGFKLA